MLSEDGRSARSATVQVRKTLLDAKQFFLSAPAVRTRHSLLLLHAVADAQRFASNLKSLLSGRLSCLPADLCKHRVAEHRDGGLSFNTIRPYCASLRV
ncbi:hypothetical protein KCP77_11690 [Salmonella enterica subsp. enterica]|nr:hypothetical protein KCP77_11690 [Salmonella enterica subsp. enterica]